MSGKQEFPHQTLKRSPTTCSSCRGPVEADHVTLILPSPQKEASKIIHGVPAGVCRQCGEQFFTFEVLQQIENILSRPPSGREELPVWEFTRAS